jgi:lipoprotein NlpI
LQLSLAAFPEFDMVYTMLGLAYQRRHDHAAAVEQLQKVLALNPDNRWATRLLQAIKK